MMRLLMVLAVSFLGSLSSQAQLKNPVKWSYNAKKIDAKTYELHVTATIDPGWHIYTLNHNSDIGVATSIKFNKNPLGMLTGKTSTKSLPTKKKDPGTGEQVQFYEGKVDFVQVVKLKAPVKTNYTGEVEFMVCDDTQCLPPSSKAFTIALQ